MKYTKKMMRNKKLKGPSSGVGVSCWFSHSSKRKSVERSEMWASYTRLQRQDQWGEANMVESFNSHRDNHVKHEILSLDLRTTSPSPKHRQMYIATQPIEVQEERAAAYRGLVLYM